MSNSNKAEDLASIKKWGEHYLDEAPRVLKEAKLSEVKEFRIELSNFTFQVQRKWISDNLISRVEPSQMDWLRDLVHKLSEFELLLANRILVIQSDQEIDLELERLAFPEGTETRQRDFTTWRRSPLKFPDELIKVLAAETAPGGY